MKDEGSPTLVVQVQPMTDQYPDDCLSRPAAYTGHLHPDGTPQETS